MNALTKTVNEKLWALTYLENEEQKHSQEEINEAWELARQTRKAIPGSIIFIGDAIQLLESDTKADKKYNDILDTLDQIERMTDNCDCASDIRFATAHIRTQLRYLSQQDSGIEIKTRI